MANSRAKNSSAKSDKRSASSVTVRLAAASKAMIAQAAKMRHVSICDYIRIVAVDQSRKDVAAARTQAILLSPEEQLTFWTSLTQPTKLTPAQKVLGRLMRGEV